MFTPEYFVGNQFSPFFYTSTEVYYKLGYAESSNTQFNSLIVNEWDDYLKHQIAHSHLEYLLLKANDSGIDSAERYASGLIKTPPLGYTDSTKSNFNGKLVKRFINYLKLAHDCESYAVNNDWSDWDTVKRHHATADLQPRLMSAFKKAPDSFIRERLWFQLVRYAYFSSDSVTSSNTVKIFQQYQSKFPKNLIWYRALGYVAGYYYSVKDYAHANYLYSLCYNYTSALKIPSFWSFHPQDESDWNATLALAKDQEERITLWQMLGIQNDAGRAIKAIAAIDPRSEKLDLLLSRLINIREAAGGVYTTEKLSDSVKQGNASDIKLVESLAIQNNTAHPYFWNLAAGYLNYLDSNYSAAARFYGTAKSQFPKNDTLLAAQGKVLDILLQVKTLKKSDAATEANLVEPLNWLANLRDNKLKIEDLRFGNALTDCTQQLSKLYLSQGDSLKALCFDDNLSSGVYNDSTSTENLINLLNKVHHTPFEAAMLRYYPHTVNDLYYHHAIRLAYKQQTRAAIAYLQKRQSDSLVLYGNPFNGRMIDCHDCDHSAPQKQTFTPLSFLQTLDHIQTAIRQGKNSYRNALLAGNAYYNMTYYGNARLFYESDITSINSYGYIDPDSLNSQYKSMAVASKYYQLARKYAVNNEQRALCTFMLAKCALNSMYNLADYSNVKPEMFINVAADNAATQRYQNYFEELKTTYHKTKYYRQALKECGYFYAYAQQPE